MTYASTTFQKSVETHIQEQASRLQLPDGLQTIAENTYDAYLTPQNAYSRPAEMFAIAAIYIGIRVTNHPLSMRDLVEDSDYQEHEIMRIVTRLTAEIGLNLDRQDPSAFVDRLADSWFAFDDRTPETAKRIIAETEAVQQGKRARAIAAGAFYLASKLCGRRVDQQFIAEAVNVSELTIRNRYQEMEAALPENFHPVRADAEPLQ